MNPMPMPAQPGFPFPVSSCPPLGAQMPPGDHAPPPKRRVRYGVLKGQIRVAEDFDAPLPAAVFALQHSELVAQA